LRWLVEEVEEGAGGTPGVAQARGGIPVQGGIQSQFLEEGRGIPANLGVDQASVTADTGPAASVTIRTFMPQQPADREATIETIQTDVETQVSEGALEQYDVLARILERINENADQRERRGALLALRQREITDLSEIILNRRSATEIDIDGRLFLFSDRPLRRIPEGAVSVDTPNLTPFDIFDMEGTVREVPE
jgi:hypothetical protein